MAAADGAVAGAGANNIVDDVVTITDQQSNKSLDSPPFMFKKEIK